MGGGAKGLVDRPAQEDKKAYKRRAILRARIVSTFVAIMGPPEL